MVSRANTDHSARNIGVPAADGGKACTCGVTFRKHTRRVVVQCPPDGQTHAGCRLHPQSPSPPSNPPLQTRVPKIRHPPFSHMQVSSGKSPYIMSNPGGVGCSPVDIAAFATAYEHVARHVTTSQAQEMIDLNRSGCQAPVARGTHVTLLLGRSVKMHTSALTGPAVLCYFVLSTKNILWQTDRLHTCEVLKPQPLPPPLTVARRPWGFMSMSCIQCTCCGRLSQIMLCMTA